MAVLTSGFENGGELETDRGYFVEFTILSAEKMYGHGIVSQTQDSEVLMAGDTKGHKVIGRVGTGPVDNTDDGETVIVENGIFRYTNDSSNPITNLMKGQVCYVTDDNTVASTSTNLVAAGIVVEVDEDDSNLVWIDQRKDALALARREAAPLRISKSDDYTVTAAEAYQGNVLFTMAAAGASKTFTLPAALAGYRVGFIRGSLTAGDDLVIDGNSAETVLGGATKTNAVDAVSQPLWLRAVTASAWVEDTPGPGDFASWA